MTNKIKPSEILAYARENGWDKTRTLVYGQGGEDNMFRNSHESIAMEMFINSRQEDIAHIISEKLK